jgi:hypothetical protein
MPLLLYDFTDVIAFGAGHSTLERAFKKAGAEMGITLSPDPMPEQAVRFTRRLTGGRVSLAAYARGPA